MRYVQKDKSCWGNKVGYANVLPCPDIHDLQGAAVLLDQQLLVELLNQVYFTVPVQHVCKRLQFLACIYRKESEGDVRARALVNDQHDPGRDLQLDDKNS